MIGWSVFDVDRTITRQPTYSLFLLFAMRRLAPWRILLAPLLIPYGIAYAARLISRRQMKEAMHRIAMGCSVPHDRAQAVGEEFVEQLFHDGLYPQAVERMDRERQQGRTLVLATAAPEFYIEPLARRLGIEHVIASPSEWRGDVLGCRIAGENCYGPEKLRRIQAALAATGIDRSEAHIRFFTDHASDRPVCEWADESFAVNPSEKMVRLATAKGWPVLDWREG